MNRKSAFIIAFTLVILLSACGPAPAPVDTADVRNSDNLTLAVGGEPDEGFDPCTGWGRYGSPLFQSTLLKYDAQMAVQPDLATSYTTSPDGLTWTFKLREGVNFTDGTPLKASDVAFTYKTAKSSNSELDLTALSDVTADGHDTVIFKMTRPMSAFASIAATTGIVPEHLYGAGYSQAPVGSGPYTFVQWDKGQQLIVARNEDYYGDKPRFQKLTFLYITEDAALAAVKAGAVDVAMTVPSMVETIKGYELLRCKSVDNRGVSLPATMPGSTSKDGMPVGNAVTADIAVRKAICIGIDRQKLVDEVLKSAGSPAYSVCDGLPWYNAESAIADADIQGATAELDTAGWKDGDGDGIREKDGVRASINLLYPASDSVRQALSMAFAQQLKEIGIEVKVQGGSWDDIGKRMYSDSVMFGWGSQSPMELYNLFYGKEVVNGYNNPTNIVNAKVDEYMDKALGAATQEEANQYWKQAQWDGTTGLSMMGDATWCWLVNIEHLYFVREGLKTGEQMIHPHGHGYPVVSNIEEWGWS